MTVELVCEFTEYERGSFCREDFQEYFAGRLPKAKKSKIGKELDRIVR